MTFIRAVDLIGYGVMRYLCDICVAVPARNVSVCRIGVDVLVNVIRSL